MGFRKESIKNFQKWSFLDWLYWTDLWKRGTRHVHHHESSSPFESLKFNLIGLLNNWCTFERHQCSDLHCQIHSLLKQFCSVSGIFLPTLTHVTDTVRTKELASQHKNHIEQRYVSNSFTIPSWPDQSVGAWVMITDLLCWFSKSILNF